MNAIESKNENAMSVEAGTTHKATAGSVYTPATAAATTGGPAPGTSWLLPVVLIWAAYAITCFMAIATSYSLAWHVTSTTSNPLLIAAVSVCAFLPQGLVSPFGGALADRANRKTILLACYAVVIALSTLVGVLTAAGFLSIPLILSYSLIMGIRNGFRDPAFNALMPMLVPEKHLIRINMLDNLLSSASMILAPALGIALYSAFGLQAPLFALAVGSALSMLTLMLVKVPTVRDADAGSTHPIESIVSGAQTLGSNKGLVVLLAVFVIGLSCYGPYDNLLPLLVYSVFGGDGFAASLIAGVFGAGMLTGAIVIMVLGEKMRLTRLIIGCAFVVSCAICASGLIPGTAFPALVVAVACCGIACAGFAGPATTLLQKNSAPEVLGRVMGLFTSCIALAMPVGTALGGVLAGLLGLQTFFVVDGLVTLAAAVIACASRSFASLDGKEERSAVACRGARS